MRQILHADLDTFFVSVERLIDPRLRGRPVIVGGQPNQRGVVSACSYEARAYGVRSGMALKMAGRKCPGGVFLPANPDAYRTYSKRVTNILTDRSPKLEKASVDEFYLDLSGCEDVYGNLKNWSYTLQNEIQDCLRLPISMGLSTSKLVAKVATTSGKGQKKMGNLIRVPAGGEANFLAPMPIENLPGIGPKTAETLRRLGLFSLKDIQETPEHILIKTLGKNGRSLRNRSLGIDYSEVITERVAKSIGHEHTFSVDTLDPKKIFATLRYLCEKTGYDLRKKKQVALRIVFKLRYADFQTTTRTEKLTVPSADDRDFYEKAKQAFDFLFRRRVKIRLIGIRAEGFVPGQIQTNLYDDSPVVRHQLLKAIDDIKQRHGFDAIRPAGRPLRRPKAAQFR